jgi:hypothetical protein
MQRRNDTGNESAGIRFTGCTGLEAMPPQPPQHAHAQAQAAPRRREVVVGGRRVKTISDLRKIRGGSCHQRNAYIGCS